MDTSPYWQNLAYGRDEISDCHTEPIQFCGATQRWGCFALLDGGKGVVLAVSENCADFLGITANQILGESLDKILRFENEEPFSADKAFQLSRLAPLVVQSTQGRLQAFLSWQNDKMAIDFERVDLSPNLAFQQSKQLQQLFSVVNEAQEFSESLQECAQHIQKLTEFNRVMIYRFEPNWDGTVVAESRAQDLEPFLDLRYPHTDIPPQARKLFLELKHRLIANVDEPPARVVTLASLNASAVDLGTSSLRAVSPFHIEYLQNMGVQASLSLPIKLHGQLWGLVACHSYTGARYLSRQTRANAELATQILIGRIGAHISERRQRVKNQIYQLSQELLDHVSSGRSALDAFKNCAAPLMSAVEAQGMFVRFADQSFTAGETPPGDFIESLLEKFRSHTDSTVIQTACAAKEFKLTSHPLGVGVMAIPLSFGFEDAIIWFRPEAETEVKWAGKPNHKELTKTLSPRGSFEIWRESIKECSRGWDERAQEAAQNIIFMFVRGIFKKAADLSKANEQLARLSDAKDEFVGTLSHELRTPLGVMIGWIDILRDEIGNQPEATQALDTIDRNAKLQISLINDLLDISRIISGKMRISPVPSVMIEKVIHEVIDDLRPTATLKAVTLAVEIATPVRSVVDPERLRQIIWNLVSNAIKFSHKGGRVQISLEKSGFTYQVAVKDSGVGLEAHQLERIFERFTQATDNSARIGGLGLGLSIVKALVELHGGQVRAASEGPGLGATFTVELPWSESDLIQNTRRPEIGTGQSKETRELAGIHILAAEDQEDAARALEYMLKKAGATVELCSNGEDALTLVSEKKFDIILSDVGMPKKSGLDFLRELRQLEREKQREHLPSVALTAYASPRDRVKCLNAGFNWHLAKPVDREELIAVVKSLIQSAGPT